jgi:hypothetical protein
VRELRTDPRQLDRIRRRVARLKALGLCVTCGLGLDGKSRSRCTVCLVKHLGNHYARVARKAGSR